MQVLAILSVIAVAAWVASKLKDLLPSHRRAYLIWLSYMAGSLFIGLGLSEANVLAAVGVIVGAVWLAANMDVLCESCPSYVQWLIVIAGFVVAGLIFPGLADYSQTQNW